MGDEEAGFFLQFSLSSDLRLLFAIGVPLGETPMTRPVVDEERLPVVPSPNERNDAKRVFQGLYFL